MFDVNERARDERYFFRTILTAAATRNCRLRLSAQRLLQTFRCRCRISVSGCQCRNPRLRILDDDDSNERTNAEQTTTMGRMMVISSCDKRFLIRIRANSIRTREWRADEQPAQSQVQSSQRQTSCTKRGSCISAS